MKTPAGTLTLTIAGVLACVGCAVIGHLGDERVAQHVDEIARLRAAIGADDALAAERVSLEQRDRAARVRLRAIVRAPDPTARVASFVRDAARIVAAHHTEIAAIVPALALRSAVSTPASPAPLSAGSFGSQSRDSLAIATRPPQDIAFDVTLDGQYANVLAAVRGFAALTLPVTAGCAGVGRRGGWRSRGGWR